MFQLPLISFFSTKFGSLPVYGLWQIIVVLLFSSVWLCLFIRSLSTFIANQILLIIVSSVFLIAILGTSIVSVYYAKSALLLATGSLLLYLHEYLSTNKRSFYLLFLFFYACSIRVSVVLLAIIPVSFLLYTHSRNLRTILNVLKYHWLSALLFLFIAESYRHTTTNPAMKIEARLEYAMYDRYALVAQSEMTTSKDSIRYQALATYSLLMDSSMINVDFINRCIDTRKYGTLFITPDDVSHFFMNSFPLIRNYFLLIALFYLLVSITLWNAGKKPILVFAIYNITGWLIVFAVGCKFTVYQFFLEPWLAFLFGGSLWIVSFLRTNPLHNWQKATYLVTLTTIFFIQVTTINSISSENKTYNQNTNQYLTKINDLSRNRIPLLWTSDECYFPTSVFAREKTDVLKKCLFMNWYYFFYFHWTQERFLQKIDCSPLDWKNLGPKLVENREKTCLVMEPQFADFISLYFKKIYDVDINLVKDYPLNEITPGNYVFHIESPE